MPEFLVGNADESILSADLRVISAESQSDAIDLYISEYVVNDQEFLDMISSKSISSSFMEQFALVGEDFDKYMESGTLALDRAKIERRVRQFFSDKSSYADLYLDYYFSDNSRPDDVRAFPKEMLEAIFLATQFMSVEAIPLHDVPRL